MLRKYLFPIIKPSAAARSFSVSPNEVDLKNAKPFADIPGPKNILHLVKLMLPGGRYHNNKPLMDLFQLLKEDYGTLCTFPGQIGQKLMVVTYLPTDFEKVFRLEGKWPYRRGLETFTYFRKEHRPDLFKSGGGLTVEQDQEWGDFRSKVNQIMMQPRNVKLYIPGIDEVSRDFITNIRAMRDGNMEMPADFWEKLNEWALESIGFISLDLRLGILNDQSASEQGKKLNALIKEIFILSYKYDILPSIWRWYKTPGFKKAMDVYEESAEIIFRYVTQAREILKNRPKSTIDPDHEGVFEKLLKIDESVAVVMAADMISAGVDTTSSAVSAVWYNLAKNPDKQEILREEVLKILPNKDSKLDIKSLDSIPYMRAVVKESLRLFPVTMGNMRSLKQDIVIQGYIIPKDTDILMIASNKKESFEEAEKFIPERWLKDNTDPKCPHVRDTNPFAFLPFGFGSRMCIGKRFAELEIEVVTARLLREFKLEWEQPDIKFKSIIINLPDSPLKFKLTDY